MQLREEQRFLQLSDAGEDEDSPRRWCGAIIFRGLYDWELNEGRARSDWDDYASAIVNMDSDGPPEDLPWTMSGQYVVSDRLRKLIERYASGSAQFLRVRMTHAGRDLDLPPYWLVNWLHVDDCIDWEKSVYQENLLRPGHYRFTLIVVDPSHARHKVFRLRHFEVETLVLAGFRDLVQNEGITGCQFYKVWHSGDALPNIVPSEQFPTVFTEADDDEPTPAARIDMVDEMHRRWTGQTDDHYRGRLLEDALSRVITKVGCDVGVDWSGDNAQALCARFLQAPPNSTGSYRLVIELSGKRHSVLFHFHVRVDGTIGFGFWGPEEFIKILREAVKDVA